MEYLGLFSRRDLKDFCAKLQRSLHYPPFEFDSENENWWGWSESAQLEINVDIPYEARKLHEWNQSCPPGCNIGILLIASKEHLAVDEKAQFQLATSLSQKIANLFATEVHYYSTWNGPGQIIKRQLTFTPQRDQQF